MTEIQNIMPKGVKFLFNQFTRYGYEIYLVGGCIRDILLNRKPSDWDMCTSAKPEEMLNLVKHINQQTNKHIKVIPTGLQHGTLTLIIDNESFEITTFRCDGVYSDNRRPDNVEFTKNLIEDLKRRDFTMNAIAYNLFSGFIDPFGGIMDINNHLIRCVGNPYERFNEDGLRILRCIRFSAQLGFSIQLQTLEAAYNLVSNLDNISAERISSELCKGLTGEHPELMMDYPLRYIIPEFIPVYYCEQNNPYHIYNVWEHTIAALKNEKSGNLIVRLALLFHDIGKPHCIQDDKENNIRHFKGHSHKSSEMTKDILKRLRFDNDTIEKVTELVFYHDATIEDGKKFVKRWLSKIGEEQFRNLLLLRECDIKAQNPIYEQQRLQKIAKIYCRLQEVLEDDECFTLKNLAING